MSDEVISIDRIEREAREAAAIYENVNDACNYPFYSPAGRAFKREFIRARLEKSVVPKPERAAAQTKAHQAGRQATGASI